MNPNQDQLFESYVPVYDYVPDKWEDARAFITEQFKKISNAVNVREIGWFLDEELLSGKQFIPSNATALVQGTAPQFRSVLRKVVNCGPLVAGVNPPIAHGVIFDANLTSIDSWVEATNSVTFQAVTLVSPELVINGNFINITSPGAFDRAIFVWEYTQEL